MRSKDVLKDVEIIYKSPNYEEDIDILYLSENTNDLKENTCFICIEGKKHDSHTLIDSFKIKPALIIANKEINSDIPYVIVSDTLKSLPLICANFFHHVSKNLDLIGITGTDGKTTTALIIKQLIEKKKPCAYIGTNGIMYHDKIVKNPLTTPKPIMLHSYLSKFFNENIPYTSIEVSSQGLDLHRVDYLDFKVAVFTNLTHEHLDYHETMENYFQSKLKLFQMLHPDSYAIINLDSPYGKRIIENTQAKIITYGKHINCDFKIGEITTEFNHTVFDLITKEKNYQNIRLNLFGDYNVYNATASLATLYALGFNLEEIIPALRMIDEIDGRMHLVNCGQPFPVIVDFAHTPNALNSLLKNINQVEERNITLVFGSAGERDHSKRPLMGKVAEKYASKIILTSEDPKSESVYDIIADINKGIKDVFKVTIIPSRKKAIVKALESANENDMVIITGKGNEQFEMFDGYVVMHNDIAIVEEYLSEKYQKQLTYSIAN